MHTKICRLCLSSRNEFGKFPVLFLIKKRRKNVKALLSLHYVIVNREFNDERILELPFNIFEESRNHSIFTKSVIDIYF